MKSKVCIYSDAVNDQGSVEECLHPERAVHGFSIPEPAEDGAGVSFDWTVEDSRATLDYCLRHVSFTLQHWRLCRRTVYSMPFNKLILS